MSDTKLDPASLTAEERAIVDHEALRFHRDWAGEARYKAALGICEPIILARRALFGETESEGIPKAWRCEQCGKALGANESHRHGDLTGDGEWWSCEPTPPGKSGNLCERCGEYLHDCQCQQISDGFGGYWAKCSRADCGLQIVRPGKVQCAHDCHEPIRETQAPPPSEMPEAVHPVARAIDALITASEYYEDEESIAVCVQAAEDLESWWRSQPAPAPVRMTPALEFILKRADFAVLQDRDDDRVDAAYADELEKMIAAVRAPQYGLPSQAEKPQGVKLPEVPVADIQWTLNVAASKAVTMTAMEACQRIKKFLAELDAAEGRRL